MQSLTSAQGHLASVAREFAEAQRKMDKARDKSGKRATHASLSVEDAGREWQSQAPHVFEQLQAVDETRINYLRDVLTQFQTHEIDHVERNRASAESCLNALLNLETADEIKTFAARVAGGRMSFPRRPSSSTGVGRAANAPAPGPPPPPPPPPPPRAPQDSLLQRAGSAYSEDQPTPRMHSFPRLFCIVLANVFV